jgi:hypothetical protein
LPDLHEVAGKIIVGFRIEALILEKFSVVPDGVGDVTFGLIGQPWRKGWKKLSSAQGQLCVREAINGPGEPTVLYPGELIFSLL